MPHWATHAKMLIYPADHQNNGSLKNIFICGFEAAEKIIPAAGLKALQDGNE